MGALPGTTPKNAVFQYKVVHTFCPISLPLQKCVLKFAWIWCLLGVFEFDCFGWVSEFLIGCLSLDSCLLSLALDLFGSWLQVGLCAVFFGCVWFLSWAFLSFLLLFTTDCYWSYVVLVLFATGLPRLVVLCLCVFGLGGGLSLYIWRLFCVLWLLRLLMCCLLLLFGIV